LKPNLQKSGSRPWSFNRGRSPLGRPSPASQRNPSPEVHLCPFTSPASSALHPSRPQPDSASGPAAARVRARRPQPPIGRAHPSSPSSHRPRPVLHRAARLHLRYASLGLARTQ
jgi:hypothetical protein